MQICKLQLNVLNLIYIASLLRYHCAKMLLSLEREPLRCCNCDGKVTFTRPFLMLGKVTSDELKRY